MQNTFEIIQGLKKQGIFLSLFQGRLKVEPKALITDDIRAAIKSHRDGITQALQKTLPGESLPVPSCWTCRHFDGSSFSWPGMCRYFGGVDSLKEIDTSLVDPDKGCRFYLPQKKPINGLCERNAEKPIQSCGSTTKMQRTINERNFAPVTDSPPVKSRHRSKERPSLVALKWLKDHRQALIDSGWTRSELYDRRKYRRGIVWLRLWNEAFSMAYLHKDGTIEFECSKHGRDYFQTARPRSMPTTSQLEIVSDFNNQF